MPLQAIALLRMPAASLAPESELRVQALDDAVLVHMREDFATEPAALSVRLYQVFGDELVRTHDDPRGIFMLPHVAAPQARSYEGVIEEIGEAGMWCPLPTALEADASGGFEAMFSQLLGQLPSSLLGAAAAAAQGDSGALQAMTREVEALMGNSAAFRGLAEQLAGALGQPGSPFAELPRDPAELTRMPEQLFGAAPEADEQPEEADAAKQSADAAKQSADEPKRRS